MTQMRDTERLLLEENAALRAELDAHKDALREARSYLVMILGPHRETDDVAIAVLAMIDAASSAPTPQKED